MTYDDFHSLFVVICRPLTYDYLNKWLFVAVVVVVAAAAASDDDDDKDNDDGDE